MYLYTFVCATKFHKICNKIDLLVSASKHVSNTDAVMLGRLQCNEAIEIFLLCYTLMGLQCYMQSIID